MSVRVVLLGSIVVGCYAPSVPSNVACGVDGACPANQQCREGVCRGGDEALDGGIDPDASPDAAPTAGAFSVPVPVPGVSSNDDDYSPSVSADQLELYFNSDRAGSFAIYLATRTSVGDPFGPPTLVAALDGTGLEYDGEVSRDSTELLFVQESGATQELQRSTRNDTSTSWGVPAVLAGFSKTAGPSLMLDDLRMLIDDDGIVEYSRDDLASPWTRVRAHSTLENHGYPGVSSDGLEVFTIRGTNLWRATRGSINAPFGSPVRVLWGTLFDLYQMADPELSEDGRTLYLSVRVGGNYKIYAATR